MRLAALVLTVIVFASCGGGGRSPQPGPTPQPTAIEQGPTPEPSIAGRPKPTPYPVPQVDVAPYLHEQGGRVVTVDVSGVEDVGKAVNQADNFDGPGKLVISGGGRIKTQVVVRHDVDWVGGIYTLDTETLEGGILLRDNVKNECKDATFI
ncbi:MAG TPA: hypothetical protein VLB68_29075, partial [Pyrinomonadaceae bacterium]|nr:hypothetical protein [Pyrinomonadaceae bacterium]